MAEEREGQLLQDLSHADLLSLRLAAQILRHKAELAGRPLVTLYFQRLELSAEAQLASQLTGIRAIVTAAEPALDEHADDDDRRLVGEYLALLTANERLSPAVRSLCRGLLVRHTE